MESELAFYSSQELIDELMRRKTFLGVVVHSEQEWKGDTWGDERTMKVQFANLQAPAATRLLGVVAEYIDLNHC